jgi:drug/metabolite transporter (DMT)-like permease
MRKQWLTLEELKAIAAIAIALFFLAIAPIFIKLVETEISSSATIFNRLWGAAIIFGLWRGFLSKKTSPNSTQKITKKDCLLFFAVGFLFLASQASWAWSLPRTSVGISDLLHNFTPIFVIFGSWLFRGKLFKINFLLGTGLSIFGYCLVAVEDLSNSSNAIQGDIAAILSAVFLAAYMLVVEMLCSKFSTVTIMFWVCFIGSVLSIPVLLIAGMQWFPLSIRGWFFLVGLVLTMVFGQGLFLYGVKRVGASFTAILFLLDPVLAAISAWVIFSEKLSYLDWGAMGIVLLGVYLAISSSSDPPADKLEEEVVSANL